MGTATQSKYLAGSETAKCDFLRGKMTLAQMAKVVQPDDDADWAAGYNDRPASYRVDAERADHQCESTTAANGHGAFCRICGETLA